jgi:hypothetical protein
MYLKRVRERGTPYLHLFLESVPHCIIEINIQSGRGTPYLHIERVLKIIVVKKRPTIFLLRLPPTNNKNTHLATPPPSPLLNNNAIAALQAAADSPSTPYRPSTGSAVAAMLFPASTKRQPSPHRPGTPPAPTHPSTSI